MIKISDTEYFSNDKTIRFLNMDCNEFMGGCKDNEFDLNLSDPPYSLSRFQRVNNETTGVYAKRGSFISKDNQNWNNEKPKKEVFDNIFRTAKNQIIWGSNNFDLPTSEYFLVWDKMQYMPNFASAELAFVSIGLKKPAQVFRFPIHQENQNRAKEGGKIHQAQKPIELYSFICDKYTKQNDTILDCFGGSMSNAIACHMKRRKLTIIELDVDYFKSALNRFEIYERQVEDIKEFGYAKTKINAQNPVLF